MTFGIMIYIGKLIYYCFIHYEMIIQYVLYDTDEI